MYISESEASTYFEGRMFAGAWTSASLSDRTKALTHASSILDQLSYRGSMVDEDQDHAFPRIIDDVEETAIPTDLKNACCEVALALLNDIDPEKEAADLNLVSASISSVRSTYDRGIVQAHVAAGIPSRVAWSYILPYLRDTRTVKIVRG